jgi:hypothetical protein
MNSQGNCQGQRTLVTGSSVLDSLQLDVAQLVAGRSGSHREGTQSSSGPAGLARNYSSSSHTKTGSDAHLTAPGDKGKVGSPYT